MANKDAAFGFRPARHLTGGLIRTNEYKIAANYGTAIYHGQAVKALAAGGIDVCAAGEVVLGIFGGCFFMLTWVKMFTLGLLGLYLSTLIPLYFSGDLKQLKIWATDPDAMDLATVPLWWLIGLSFLMLWIIIAMLLF